MDDVKKYKLTCKYCANTQYWTFEPDSDFDSMWEVLKYDYEDICNQCGSPFRVNEGLSDKDLKELEWLS